MEGWGWQSVHDPAVLPAVMQRWQASIATGQPFEMTFPLKGADGIYRPFLTRVNPVRDETGQVARWFGVNTDISEQVAAEDAAKALLYEVNHRVKNSLQIVTSLLALQEKSAKTPEAKSGLAEARARIGVVASIHTTLYKTSSHTDLDIGEYLIALTAEIMSVAGHDKGVQLATECTADRRLSIREAVPLALIVSELLTNCLKYAFTGCDKGQVNFSVSERDGELVVEVRDNGCGLPADFDPKRSGGMGMRVIFALAKQLRAKFDYVSTPRAGTTFKIQLALR